MFKKYQHLEKWGNLEVEGIDIGDCYIFSKLDGSNSSVWLEDNTICAGSRNRKLTLDNDNQGFYNSIIENDNINKYLNKYPNHTLYGEWLVPHTLKTYKDDAWRKFYIFDIIEKLDNGELRYIPYEDYESILKEYELD